MSEIWGRLIVNLLDNINAGCLASRVNLRDLWQFEFAVRMSRETQILAGTSRSDMTVLEKSERILQGQHMYKVETA